MLKIISHLDSIIGAIVGLRNIIKETTTAPYDSLDMCEVELLTFKKSFEQESQVAQSSNV